MKLLQKKIAGRWMSAKSGQVGAFFCAPKCSTQQPVTFVSPGKSSLNHSPFTVQMTISWGHGEFQKWRIFTKNRNCSCVSIFSPVV
jgi:hypothetical protein